MSESRAPSGEAVRPLLGLLLRMKTRSMWNLVVQAAAVRQALGGGPGGDVQLRANALELSGDVEDVLAFEVTLRSDAIVPAQQVG